jgi:hypothetical protein
MGFPQFVDTRVIAGTDDAAVPYREGSIRINGLFDEVIEIATVVPLIAPFDEEGGSTALKLLTDGRKSAQGVF